MFELEPSLLTPAAVCPDCSNALHREDELLRCDEHGAFFIYGPQLLVRCAPELQEQAVLTLLPWQRMGAEGKR